MSDAHSSSSTPPRRRFNPTGLAGVSGLMLVFGLFFAAIGPFDTIDVPIGPRLVYWLVVMVLGGGIIKAVEHGFARLWPIENRVLHAIAVTLGVTPLQTLIVTVASAFILTNGVAPAQYFSLLPAVLIITLGVVAVLALLRLSFETRESAVSAAARAEGPAAAHDLPPALARHLPAKLRSAALIALQAEDHYVRIHTDAGSTLVLMRFSDAVADAEAALPGFRLHRSWWASEAGLETVSFKRGSGQAQLAGGLMAPVSRTYARTLREAGWF